MTERMFPCIQDTNIQALKETIAEHNNSRIENEKTNRLLIEQVLEEQKKQNEKLDPIYRLYQTAGYAEKIVIAMAKLIVAISVIAGGIAAFKEYIKHD